MTVLFAEVVRSMDIAAAEGSERLREIMAALLDPSAAVAKRHGGTLSQFTRDVIMAVFGAPITLEDQAFRACMAALDIQKDVGCTLQLRSGLNSGQVIAGEIGSNAGSYTTIAGEIGVAPGQILFLSDAVAELDAARTAGLATALCVRPGSAAPPGTSVHQVVRTFDDITN